MKVRYELLQLTHTELTLLHSSGECKEYMIRYLKCMKTSKAQSTECRHLSKEYLNCRMEKSVLHPYTHLPCYSADTRRR